MINIEKYKDEMLNAIENGDDLIDALCSAFYNNSQDAAGDLDVLNWLCGEYKEPILNEEEKKYLSAVIKPFRDRVVSISKRILKRTLAERSYIEINIDNGEDNISLPYFEKGTMYKNMERNKEYTLEELGL